MLGNRGAIHIHPRPVAAQRMVVDSAGNHLFSHAGFAHDQHGFRTPGELLRQAYHPLEGVAADNGLAPLTRLLNDYRHNLAPTLAPLSAAACLPGMSIPSSSGNLPPETTRKCTSRRLLKLLSLDGHLPFLPRFLPCKLRNWQTQGIPAPSSVTVLVLGVTKWRRRSWEAVEKAPQV